MLKTISFFFGCSKSHIALYFSIFASAIGILLMYTLEVVSHNHEFNISPNLEVSSGLQAGFYQQMIMYTLNSITLLYFVIFIFKSPSQEGYELTLLSKKQTRLKILLSRIFLISIFILMMSAIELSLLIIPAKLDVVMNSDDTVK